MRLFVAIDISESTRAVIPQVRAAIERSAGSAARPPRITWVREAIAHVTLRFVGEVDEAQAFATAAALSPPLELTPFDVEWRTLGVFPPGRSGLRAPRAIWIGASAGADALTDLAALVNQRIAPVVGHGADRPYSPHLTVGRVKDPGRGVAWADALAAAIPAPTRTRVDRVTLYQSQLSPRGPTYTAITVAALRG